MLDKLKNLFASNRSPEKNAEEDNNIEIAFIGPPSPEVASNPNFITEPRKIVEIIRSIMDIPLVCSIPSTPDEDVYISKIIELRTDKAQLLLKPLFPDFGNTLLQQHQKLQLSTHLNGIHMSINLSQISTHKLQNSLYYSAAIPERIFYPQRRKSLRFATSEHNITFYGISERTGATICGSVINLSRRGCAIMTNNAAARSRTGETLHDCLLNIGHHTRIYFDFTIRHINSHSDTLVILGGTFPYIENMQEQFALDQFLNNLITEEKNTLEAQNIDC